jgi:hypothetical protein
MPRSSIGRVRIISAQEISILAQEPCTSAYWLGKLLFCASTIEYDAESGFPSVVF